MAKGNNKGSLEGKAPHLRLRDQYNAGDYAGARAAALAIAADAEASHEAKAEAERVLHGTAVDVRALQIGVACVALAGFVIGVFIL